MTALTALARATDGEPEWAYAAMRHGVQMIGGALGSNQGRGSPSDLDPAVTCLIALTQEWTAHVGRFSLVHDTSNEVARWRLILEGLSYEQATPFAARLWSGNELRYPLGINDLELVDSQSALAVQLADIVAGAAAMICTAMIGASSDIQFTERLQATGVLEFAVDSCLWPTHDITPERLGVQPGAMPRPADALARWVP